MQLIRHADSKAGPIAAIAVTATRRACLLALTYSVHGDTKGIRLSQTHLQERADRLWEHTCFEAFLRDDNSAGYREFNFSSSLKWAAYRFSGYRAGMMPETAIKDPEIAVRSAPSAIQLSATLDLSGLQSGAEWLVGMSAIIEHANGDRSYWALAHPPGKPDFHHPAGFCLRLKSQESGHEAWN